MQRQRASASKLPRRAERSYQTKGPAANGPEALDALRQWRKKTTTVELPRKAPDSASAEGVKKALPKARSFTKLPKQDHEAKLRALPTCVATWHAWFKGMDTDSFYKTVADRPSLLQTYTATAHAEGMAGAQDEVIGTAAELLQQALRGWQGQSRPELVDLGCGEGYLADALNGCEWPDGCKPAVTLVDAAPLSEDVQVHNLGLLPNDWSARFDVAVLCRALWGTDYIKVLKEAKRVLKQNPSSILLVVEPFKRWWCRKQAKTEGNSLIAALQEAGFTVRADECTDIKPPNGADHMPNAMEGVFQYVVARLS